MSEPVVFDDGDQRYLAWLGDHLQAYVLNARSGPTNKYAVLHRANCHRARDGGGRSGALTENGYIKVGADDVAAIEAWCKVHRPRAKLYDCKTCFPLREAAPDAPLPPGAGPSSPRPTSSFWWVNHKQTHRAEIDGGYIWSPKVKSNGGRNQSYENLTLVRPGDVVVSYAGGTIKAIGVATAGHREEGKPEEFGSSGDAWGLDGWLVPIDWQMVDQPISPKTHLETIRPLLPERHSPIQPESGNGNQGVYLAAISEELGELLLRLAGQDGEAVLEQADAARTNAEADQAELAIAELPIASTEKSQLVMARRGQGAFRLNVSKIEVGCRLTGTTDKRFLIASHIKPWSVCDNSERLDGSNGLLLAPHVDRLFDQGWISFDDDGVLLIASEDISQVLQEWKLELSISPQPFTQSQRSYLAYHRGKCFRPNKLSKGAGDVGI